MNRPIVPPSKPYIVLMEDPIIHTDDHPFCSDPTCECHSDQAAIDEMNDLFAGGLLTEAEAARIYYDCQVN